MFTPKPIPSFSLESRMFLYPLECNNGRINRSLKIDVVECGSVILKPFIKKSAIFLCGQNGLLMWFIRLVAA